MTIIKIAAHENGGHIYQTRADKSECWYEGWVAVPPELEQAVLNADGYGDLTIENGVLADFTPTEKPTPPPAEDTEDAVTWEDMAAAIAEGVNDV